MPLIIPASATDVVEVLILLLSQWPLLWFLVRDLRPHVPRPVWALIFSSLLTVWAVCATGILLQIFSFYIRTALLLNVRTLAVAIQLVWGILSAYMVTMYALYKAVLARSHPAEFSPARRAVLKIAVAGAVAAPVAALGFGALIERTRFFVKEIDLPVPGLHPDLAGLRIVQISDLHVSAFLSVADAARVVDMANELRADLAFVTGDIISSFGDPLEASIRELGRLRAPAGILGCHGNHEIYANCQGLATRLGKAHGIEFLRDQAKELRFGNGILNVTGVDFQPSGTRARYLRGAERHVIPGVTNLLLSHSPDVFPVAVAKGFDTILAGHTHGGQVTVEILNQTVNLARVATPYVAGLYRIDKRSCYVTAGIGTIGLPVRLGAPPEITLLRLRPA